MFREARERLGDPVDAWAEIVDDPERARTYKRQRGKGGFVRASWDEVTELVAAAHVHTIKRYGPDRVVGFSIPAMSMASYAASRHHGREIQRLRSRKQRLFSAQGHGSPMPAWECRL